MLERFLPMMGSAALAQRRLRTTLFACGVVMEEISEELDKQLAERFAAELSGDFDRGFDSRHDRRGAMQEERRQHPRYAVDAPVEVLVSDGSLLFRGRVRDISLTGCYIQTEARLRLAQGTPVEMVFRFDDAIFRMVAASRMLRPGKGAGFLFLKMDGRMRAELEALIRALSAG
jgi:hypothetical protein